jgi:hypothetical protein
LSGTYRRMNTMKKMPTKNLVQAQPKTPTNNNPTLKLVRRKKIKNLNLRNKTIILSIKTDATTITDMRTETIIDKTTGTAKVKVVVMKTNAVGITETMTERTEGKARLTDSTSVAEDKVKIDSEISKTKSTTIQTIECTTVMTQAFLRK